MDIVERLTSHWGGERCVDVSIDVADAIDEIKRLRDEIYNLKLAVAGGEDAPGSADLVGPEDVIMWRKLWADEIERVRSDYKRLFGMGRRYNPNLASLIEENNQLRAELSAELKSAFKNGYDTGYTMGYSEGVKETLYDGMPRLDDRGDKLDGN